MQRIFFQLLRSNFRFGRMLRSLTFLRSTTYNNNEMRYIV